MANDTNDSRTAERHPARSGWPAITGLLLLSAIPVIGGFLRLGDVGAAVGTRSVVASIAAVVHIVGMSVYCLVGAFQFSPALRTRRGGHRSVGRFLIPTGLIAAIAALWLAVFFTGPAEERGLAVIRLVLAAGMLFTLTRGAAALTRLDWTAHGAWMTRAYAIAVANGTQTLVIILWSIPFGDVNVGAETVLIAVGSAVNVVIAELIIRRRNLRRRIGPRARSLVF